MSKVADPTANISKLERSAADLEQRVRQLETSLTNDAQIFYGELLAEVADVMRGLGTIDTRLHAVEATVIVTTPTPPPTPAPVFTSLPSIAGNARSGQTLTAHDGTVSNGAVTTRQWLRGTTAISGANGATYLVADADVGTTLALRETASGPGGTVTATSANTAIVQPAATPPPAPTPRAFWSDPFWTDPFWSDAR